MKKHLLITVFVSVLMSGFVFVSGSYFMGNFENKKIANVNLGNEYTIVAGVIRNTGHGWGLIQDDTHETIGITSIEQTNVKIIVKYPKNSKINAMSVTVDETMAAEGYNVGASVGPAETWIMIYDKDNQIVDPKDYANNTGNIWIQGIFRK